MSEKKTKEQLLDELIRMQKNIEQKVEEQDGLIKRFQLLTRHEGLFSQVIGNFPYPIAVFERSGVLTMANQTMLQKARIKPGDVDGRRINFMNRITPDNAKALEAAEAAFAGETTLVQNLVEPLSMFAGEHSLPDYSDNYQRAVFFPVFTDDGNVTHGVVMLMK